MHRAAVVLFLALMWIPEVSRLTIKEATKNLSKHQVEKFDWEKAKTASTFLAEVSRHYDSNFGFRTFLIKANNLLRFRFLKTSANRKVVLGRNGWFYYNDQAQDNAQGMRRLLGISTLSPEELNQQVMGLTLLALEMQKRQVPLFLAIAPAKERIYDDHLPSWAQSGKFPPLFEQYKEAIKGVPWIKFVDLTDTLRDGRKVAETFYRTDTHWNQWGSYLAAAKIAEEMHDAGVTIGTNQITTDDIRFNQKRNYAGDLVRMLALQEHVKEENFVVRLKGKTRAKLDIKGKVVLWGGSFSTRVTPFLRWYADVKEMDGNQSFGVHDEYIQKLDEEKPDAVVLVPAERYWLRKRTPEDSAKG